MNVLVTGSSGKIGTRLTELLEKSGFQVTGFDLVPPEKGEYEFIKGDLRDYNSLKEAIEKVDIVIHLGAYPNEMDIPTYPEGWDVNFTGTFNVFEASVRSGVKKVIFASSICATGAITWRSSEHAIEYFPIDELHPCRPENLYGTGKLVAENLARMYSKMSATSFVGFRMATVWFEGPKGGPDETTEWYINNFVKDPEAALDVQPPVDEKISTYQIRNQKAMFKDVAWQYVGAKDVAEAFRLAIENKNGEFEVYNVGAADTPTAWKSIELAQFFYPDVQIRKLETFLNDENRPLWDISKAQRKLGFRPKTIWEDFLE